MGEKILEMRQVTKRFGSLIANNKVDFDLERGEVHALLGENGAGKTTLMNCLYGIYMPEEGEILLKGQPLRLKNPKDAIAHNIGMVHQHFMLVPPLTVLQNIVLGQECKLTPMNLSKARKTVEELCEKYHFQLELDQKVANLSVGAQQRGFAPDLFAARKTKREFAAFAAYAHLFRVALPSEAYAVLFALRVSVHELAVIVIRVEITLPSRFSHV